MEKNLVIVESPAKAKTIEKVLGSDYLVKSSFGHIRDLSKKNFGVDSKNGFTPNYEIQADKAKLVEDLKKLAKTAPLVWLASDDDREGEAIAWHLKETLGLDNEKTRRIAFHEITKDAILEAIANPREVNMDLVMAQQARRILDRLVGYELSPILWKKVKPKLSAGRVQSVAVRLVVDREREILHFNSTSYFKVEGLFYAPDSTAEPFKAELSERYSSPQDAKKFLQSCLNATFRVADIDNKKGHKSPAAPFTTSTLQQEASRKLGFPVGQTMAIAQHLYEAGLITYMRTDSTHLSNLALNAAKMVIETNFGSNYCKTRQYATKTKGAQEAHEAIRPTYINNSSIEGSSAEKRLYDLIWKRTIASQMADAQVDKTQISIAISTSPLQFFATGEVVTFDGFLKVYMESTDDEPEKGNRLGTALPALTVGQNMNSHSLTATERHSQQPPRYTEASLVKKMEDLGIGRPSTYAPTISTILQREYVAKMDRPANKRNFLEIKLSQGSITEQVCTENVGEERNKLNPTNIGILVNDFLVAYFPNIVDYGFTAKAEAAFDQIAAGKLVWNQMLDNFYSPFQETLNQVLETSRPKNGERLLGKDPKSGKNIYVRLGRFGPMAQIGESDDTDKRYAGLHKGQLLETITLEEALQLFSLPREMGDFQDHSITVAIGRFGPYVKWNGKFVSLEKTDDPYTLTLERAQMLILQAEEKEAKKHIMEFPEQGIQVLRGRFGPYIQQNKTNYKIPKTFKPECLSLEECLVIIEKAKQDPPKASKK